MMIPDHFPAALVPFLSIPPMLLLQRYVAWQTSPLAQIPGPPLSNFWIGNMDSIVQEPFMDPAFRWWDDAVKENGGDSNIPLLRYSNVLGGHNLIALDCDLVESILVDASYRECPLKYIKGYKILKQSTGDGLVTLEGPDWYRHRKLIQPSFQTSNLTETLNECVPERTRQLMSFWREEIKKEKGNCIEIDLETHTTALTLDVIGDVAFSHDFKAMQQLKKGQGEEQVDTLTKAIRTSLQISPVAFLLSVANLLSLEKYLRPKVERTRQIIDEAVNEIIQNAKHKIHNDDISNNNKNKNNKRISLLQMLLNAQDRLSDLELRDETKTFIIAGHETTATWLYWALYNLAKFPEIQEKVFQDIDSLRSKDIELNAETVKNMPYFLAFCSEVLRLHPPVGIFSRRLQVDEVWKGYTIPSNTQIAIPIHVLHRHPHFWMDDYDLHEFRPERWLGGKRPYKHRFAYIPFSAGERNCIGQRFSEVEAQLILATIISEFQMSLNTKNDNSISLVFTTASTIKNKTPIRICLEPRE